MSTLDAQTSRIEWVDYAKGICIILVVMMHSVLDYGHMVGAEGWMHPVVDFAKPFRMPDFFLIAGLFLSKSIFGSKIDYFDRKFVHFAYFYVIWLAIQTVAFEASLIISDPLAAFGVFAKALIVPNGHLWFVHMLAVFYLATWALRYVPKLAVFGGAAALQMMFAYGVVDTGWSVTNRFAEWFVYFYAGYAFAPLVFTYAVRIAKTPRIALEALALWAAVNYLLVARGVYVLPGVSLLLGLAGAGAIITAGALLAKYRIGTGLRYAGKHSIVIYLTFFLPMKIAQKGLETTGLVPDVGTATVLILLAGVCGPLVFHWVIRHTPLIALYERPSWAKLPQTYTKPRVAREQNA